MKTFKPGNLKVGGAGSNFVQWSLWVITKGPSPTSKGLGYVYFCLWGNSTKCQSLFQSKHCILQGITHSHITPDSVMPPDGCLVWVLNIVYSSILNIQLHVGVWVGREGHITPQGC